MTEKRAGRELAKWVAVTLAVLLGLYVGAYFWLVEPVDSGFTLPETQDLYPPVAPFPSPERGGNLDEQLRTIQRWQTFFAPINWLDRRIRPRFWAWPENP